MHKKPGDIRKYNREAWNRLVRTQYRWTVPVSSEEVARARLGDFKIYLTPTRPVPENWFPKLGGCITLCLASGGGQQGPLLAAAGAIVTVFDNSPEQLAQDRLVANREDLQLELCEGDMRNLSAFDDHSFDLIVHPVSNIYIPDVRPVWRECYRVLKPGGILIAGFDNPVIYIFDYEKIEQEQVLEVKYRLPYSDLESLPEELLQAHLAKGDPLEFSHSLEEQIGGQMQAGFLLNDLYEDSDSDDSLIDQFFPHYIATRAIKPI